MTDCLWADVSEYQPTVNDTYPYHFIAIRSNDGTYLDKKFQANLAWCKKAYADKRLVGFAVYFVFEPNWRDTLAAFKQAVGRRPHPGMAVMIDAETWGGKMSGDHSAALNGCREAVIAWLRPYMTLQQRLRRLARKRVIGYGNAGDLAAMWPKRGDTKIVLANYSTNPAYPGKLAHQFSDHFYTPPFGYADINSADGLSPAQLATALGLPDNSVTAPVPAKPPVVVVIPPPPPVPVPPRPQPTPRDPGLDRILTELRAYLASNYTKG